MNFVFTFLAAGVVEEVVKFVPVLYARYRYRDGRGRGRETEFDGGERREGGWKGDRRYIDFAIAGTLGFGVVEALGFIYGVCGMEGVGRGMLVLMVLERVAGQMGHLATGALSAVRATRRDFYDEDGERKSGNRKMSWWWVVGPSALYHGLSDFVALSASALDGNVGFIHPRGVKLVVSMIGVIGCIWGAAGWQMWRNWEDLDELDRHADVNKAKRFVEKSE